MMSLHDAFDIDDLRSWNERRSAAWRGGRCPGSVSS